ncbi:MAG: hypothetical protein F6K50_19485 [Moorea sp. SIO3I7]|nr:hypothetical protein [Moorena sp. SIO3I8]NEN97627.1 hypothetical protein [Moorena sp. SIO3I7]NEO08097.1 hypothetical protein [Moorena sp. SIO3I8]
MSPRNAIYQIKQRKHSAISRQPSAVSRQPSAVSLLYSKAVRVACA